MLEKLQNFIQKTQPSAFTLIELLVVMSIMSLLMSIMLPALSGAREQGMRIDCLSNLRQLTMAWYLYATDNQDKPCSPDTSWNDGLLGVDRNHWVADGPAIPGNDIGGTDAAIKEGVLWSYTKSVGLYRCKRDRTNHLRSYSISNTMGGIERGGIVPFQILGDISRSTEKIVFADADTKMWWLIGSFQPLKFRAGSVKWYFAKNGDGWPCNNITARHGNGCNLSFADMHCEYRKWRDLRTVDLANEQISENAASDDNSDLEFLSQSLEGYQ